MDDLKNDIEKYLKGELTDAQRHALERKALDDPFLADALEGLEEVPSDLVMEDIGELRSKLVQRVANKKTSPWKWAARIAAGLALIAVGAFIFFEVSNRNKTGELALNKSVEIPSPEVEEQAAQDADEPAEVTEPIPEISRPKEEAKSQQVPPADGPVAKTESAPKTVESSPSQQPSVNEDRELALTDETAENEIAGEVLAEQIIVESDKAKSQASTFDGRSDEARPATAKRLAPSLNVSRKVIRGKVTMADDGTGIPGVNVLLKDTNEGTVTDAQGNYEIAVNDNNPMLQFSFIGFTTKEVEASSDELNVSLEDDISELSEVVVVGYSGMNDASALPPAPPVMELAAPAGGRRQFKKYLAENMRYPEQALKNNVEGKVTIQFTVGTTGQVSDFRVIRGIGYGCDEEVIRLIKQGPKWSPTKRNDESVTDRVRVRMRFSLPKK